MTRTESEIIDGAIRYYMGRELRLGHVPQQPAAHLTEVRTYYNGLGRASGLLIELSNVNGPLGGVRYSEVTERFSAA